MAAIQRSESIERTCAYGVCDGSGWVIGEDELAHPCKCRAERIQRGRTRGISSVIPARYRGVSFDRPPVTEIDRVVVGAVRRWIDDLEPNLADGRGLWMMGSPGTGKTTLAMLVSKMALDSGHSVAIYSLPKLLARIRRTYDSEPGTDSYLAFFERLTSVDLLHIDDFGAEKSSEWVLEQLYSLINERYESRRSVLITTNLTQDELEEQIGVRTVSRLVEICGDPLPLFGVDQRMPSEHTLAPDPRGNVSPAESSN